jgi:hypothetical protein
VCHRLMKWHAERLEHRSAEAGEDAVSYGDHFDGSNWKQMFCEDPMVTGNGGPDSNIALNSAQMVSILSKREQRNRCGLVQCQCSTCLHGSGTQ